jgi:hypothetical protein
LFGLGLDDGRLDPIPVAKQAWQDAKSMAAQAQEPKDRPAGNAASLDGQEPDDGHKCSQVPKEAILCAAFGRPARVALKGHDLGENRPVVQGSPRQIAFGVGKLQSGQVAFAQTFAQVLLVELLDLATVLDEPVGHDSLLSR